VIEPLALQCPVCGEEFAVPADFEDGPAEFVVDCEICCRPMTVVIRVQHGEVVDLQVTAA